MIEKTCTSCGIIKPLEDYGLRKEGKYGKNSICKVCSSAKRKKYRLDNIEKERSYGLKYRATHDRLDYQKNYRIENSERIKEYFKNRKLNNGDRILEISAEYRKNNRLKVRARNLKWYRANKKQCHDYLTNKRRTDPKAHIQQRMRGFVRRVLESTNTHKNNSTVKLIGYSNKELIEHLNKGFYTYEDYMKGGLHIDHIVPLTYFTKNIKDTNDVEEVLLCIKRANSLENLRIIKASDNISKGNKICIPLINKYKLHHLLT